MADERKPAINVRLEAELKRAIVDAANELSERLESEPPDPDKVAMIMAIAKAAREAAKSAFVEMSAAMTEAGHNVTVSWDDGWLEPLKDEWAERYGREE
jgi:hypothetical protein